ncbi:photosystem II biogenesis protein Psp29 [Cyanobacterium sp. Dongsha4]|uniref:photosystem II biogenesis protein Psp29 n=1 Tax=Cyanobacterium sp. DS4 TaxID=2878255 RepID=UPI002E8100A8|nr:photosystem II biogenesis protein Psp29 [Cyanobacterium sp. Dongsha4]WVL01474.1 photosystem II biogenesis protein Psp29 [Cyanobacterium sp. Dongsha4]
MDKNRTVSDTKRSFYQHHQRPINSIYRRVVEELMVEMHLLAVNVDFNPDPIYYLGVYQSFQQFMQGYKPESDKESIFNALCQSVEDNPQEYISKSQTLLNFAEGKSAQEILDWLLNPSGEGDLEGVASHWRGNLENPRFKYSRLFAIGFYTLIEKGDGEFIKDESKFTDFIQPLIDKLQLPVEKLKKDLDLYRSNLEKMNQMLSVMADVLEAERKKKQAESK